MISSFRISRAKISCKKDILKNVAKFTGKHLGQSLFILYPTSCYQNKSVVFVLIKIFNALVCLSFVVFFAEQRLFI